MAAGALVNTPKNQQGLALLVLVIIIVLAFASYSLSGLSINQLKAEQAEKTRIALKKAKAALIAHAITHADQSDKEGKMGYLPCTSSGAAASEGGSDGNCDTKRFNTSGYFPWASLETGILLDESGACLRYVVSGSYKNSPHSGMINEDSYGMLKLVDDANVVIVGANPEDRIVAMVFAPGEPLTGQARTFDNTSFCGKDDNPGEYLEGNGVTNNGILNGVADVDDEFIHAIANSESAATPYNDRFVSITRDEIWEPILNRSDFTQKMENLTQALAMCLAEYANLAANTSRRLPWPVITNLDGNDYRDNDSYQDDDVTSAGFSGYSGRFPFNVASSNATIGGAFVSTDLFDAAACSSLAVGAGASASTADLVDTATEYRKLWDNWKDHFFYVLSKRYEPGGPNKEKCGGNKCIRVNVTKYAGAVIFSGRRLDGVTRDNKSVVADYLEDGKDDIFVDEADDKDGNERYDYTDPQTDTENDIMYCIENNKTLIDDPSTPLVNEAALSVIECI